MRRHDFIKAIAGGFSVPAKRHSVHEIVEALRLVRTRLHEGQRVSDAVRAANVTVVTYYRWRRKYEGLNDHQIKYLVELEADNSRLRRAISELDLDKRIWQEVAREKLATPSVRRACVELVTAALDISERRACKTLGQHRSTQRKIPKRPRQHRPPEIASSSTIDAGRSAAR